LLLPQSVERIWTTGPDRMVVQLRDGWQYALRNGEHYAMAYQNTKSVWEVFVLTRGREPISLSAPDWLTDYPRRSVEINDPEYEVEEGEVA
jgi:hypothetical protein